MLKTFDRKLDFKKISATFRKFLTFFENFPKNRKIEIFIENFRKIEISKIFENRDFRWKFRFFDFSKNFQKMSKIFWKLPLFFWNRVFDQKFSIFFDDLFLNRSRIFWAIQKWSLEMPRMQRGCVSERNVTAYRLIKSFLILSRKC